MKIAIEGCAHGELDKIYETLNFLEKENKVKVDLLIICGDFQSVRNRSDLRCMAVPPKYQKLNTFYKYYSGEKKAPVLTIFVGGNHEASNYLSELSYGGWVCPNIYYLGYASVINIGGLRIGGLSGIYKGNDYLKGHFELLPYDDSTKRSAYHVRNIDVFRLKQIKEPIDIFISHDWPRGVYNFGNKVELLRFKPFFKEEIENEKLGSRPAEELLHKLCPSYWFAAHLHCKFSALVPHEKDGKKTYTKFLALDKCLPHRKFLQIIDVDQLSTSTPLCIKYDPEWMCILRSTKHLFSVSKNQSYMPGPGCSQRWDFSVTEEELETVKELCKDNLTVPDNFIQTAPPHSMQTETPSKNITDVYINPQTTAFCKMLDIDDPLEILVNGSSNKNLSVINISQVEDLDVTNTSQSSLNPDEISLDENLSDDEQESPSEDLQNTSSSSSFYIDKKGSSCSDSPLDKISSAERYALHNHYSSTPVSNSDASSLTFDFPEFKEQTYDQEQEEKKKILEAEKEQASESSPVKKLKRRNLSLYMNSDDDDDKE